MATNPQGELEIPGDANIGLYNDDAIASRHGGTAHFTAAGGNLYPADPSAGDIKQQALGDCFLLAAALAVIARPGGPKTVVGLMKEVNGRVVVRLYDKGEAKYISLQKTIRKNSEKHNGGALWATFLEKAYAAAPFTSPNLRKDDKPTGALLTGYAKIGAGGKASDAFGVLLGVAGKKSLIASTPFHGDMALQFGRLWSLDLNGADESDLKIYHTYTVPGLIRDVFGGDGEKWNQFLLWRTIHVKGQWEVLLNAHGDIKDKAQIKANKPDPSTVRRRVGLLRYSE